MPDTFELLAANVARLPLRNISLMNLAASDRTVECGMEIPKFESGLDNYYMANIAPGASGLNVLAASIDSLGIESRVSFIKIDAEGHELSVLRGISKLLRRDMPVLLVEDNSQEIREYLGNLGYSSRAVASSSNRIFEPSRHSAD